MHADQEHDRCVAVFVRVLFVFCFTLAMEGTPVKHSCTHTVTARQSAPCSIAADRDPARHPRASARG